MIDPKRNAQWTVLVMTDVQYLGHTKLCGSPVSIHILCKALSQHVRQSTMLWCALLPPLIQGSFYSSPKHIYYLKIWAIKRIEQNQEQYLLSYSLLKNMIECVYTCVQIIILMQNVKYVKCELCQKKIKDNNHFIQLLIFCFLSYLGHTDCFNLSNKQPLGLKNMNFNRGEYDVFPYFIMLYFHSSIN